MAGWTIVVSSVLDLMFVSRRLRGVLRCFFRHSRYVPLLVILCMEPVVANFTVLCIRDWSLMTRTLITFKNYLIGTVSVNQVNKSSWLWTWTLYHVLKPNEPSLSMCVNNMNKFNVYCWTHAHLYISFLCFGDESVSVSCRVGDARAELLQPVVVSWAVQGAVDWCGLCEGNK
jgi:hypothetical protein